MLAELKMPKVSVVVPVYKTEKYLVRCIESLQKQTLREIEIILVDDGSPDDSPDICDKYAESDSRIRVIHKANQGVFLARESGIKKAKAKYIGFVDSDDYVSETYYENLYQAIQGNNADMSCASFTELHENGKVLYIGTFSGIYEGESLNKDFYPNCFLDFRPNMHESFTASLCTKLFLKEQLLFACNEIADKHITYREDYLLVFHIVMRAHKLVFVPNETGYYYVMRESSSQHSYRNNYLEIYKSLQNELKNIPYPTTASIYARQAEKRDKSRNAFSILLNESDPGKTSSWLETKKIIGDILTDPFWNDLDFADYFDGVSFSWSTRSFFIMRKMIEKKRKRSLYCYIRIRHFLRCAKRKVKSVIK